MSRRKEETYKKYCKLENGRVETCYYGTGQPKKITKQGKKYYMSVEEYSCGMFFNATYEILKFSDRWEELTK